MNNAGSLNRPPNHIDVATHRLEQSRVFVAGLEFADSYLRPEVYNVEFVTRELAERASRAVQMRATALYSYARFEDENLKFKYPIWGIRYERHIMSLKDHIKHWFYIQWRRIDNGLRRWRREHAARVGDPKPYNNGLPKFPKRLEPEWATFEIVERRDEQKNIERIQEALLSQIALFYKYDLVPQAVLVTPGLKSGLIAAYTMAGRPCQAVMSYGGGPGFAGLPVIACPELAQGAMVV